MAAVQKDLSPYHSSISALSIRFQSVVCRWTRVLVSSNSAQSDPTRHNGNTTNMHSLGWRWLKYASTGYLSISSRTVFYTTVIFNLMTFPDIFSTHATGENWWNRTVKLARMLVLGTGELRITWLCNMCLTSVVASGSAFAWWRHIAV